MSGFFKYAVNNNLITEWKDILDWFFDDNRFSNENGWTKSDITKFTGRITKMFEKDNINFVHETRKNINFSDISKKDNSYIYMVKCESKGKDFVRHIRNGIAHGNTNFKKIKNELYIEIIDYNKNKEITAKMFFKVDYIIKAQKIYRQIELEFSKNRPKKQYLEIV